MPAPCELCQAEDEPQPVACGKCGFVFQQQPAGQGERLCKSIEIFRTTKNITFEASLAPKKKPSRSPIEVPIYIEPSESEPESSATSLDPLYKKAVELVLKSRRASISYIQRDLKIGYNRAASFIEQMEQDGLVSPMLSNGNRDVLVSSHGTPIPKPTRSPSPEPKPASRPPAKPIPEPSKSQFAMSLIILLILGYLIFKALVWGYHSVKPYFASSTQTEQNVSASTIPIDALPAEIDKDILAGNLDVAKDSLNVLFLNYANEQTKFPNLFDAAIKSSLHLGKAYADKEKLSEASAIYKLAHDFFAQKNSALDASTKLLRVQVDANIAALALVAKNFQDAIEYGNSALAIKLFASDRDTTAAIKAAERAIIFAYFLDARYEQAALAANKLDFNKLNKVEIVQFQLITILSKSFRGDLGAKNDYEKLVEQYGQPLVDQSVDQIKLVAGESQSSELVASEVVKLATPRETNSILDSTVSSQ